MLKRQIEIEKCCKSLQVIYNELAAANVEGLHDKALAGKSCDFLVVMPKTANGDLDSGHNIFIDVEEWGFVPGDDAGAPQGEVTFNYGYGHMHFGYGRNGSIEECAKDIAGLVKDIQEHKTYAFGIITAIGSVRSGYRNTPESEDLTIKNDFEMAYMMDYYRQNMYKEGMPEIPDTYELVAEIVEKLEAVEKKDELRYVFWNEEQTIVTLFGKEEEEED